MSSDPQTNPSQRALGSVNSNAIEPGMVLQGRYRLEVQIGEGGMGTVWRAVDQELDRPVAVKLLATGLLHDAEVLERFEREAKLTAKLDHPNIVPIFDVGRLESRPFLVMKLLEGETLADQLRRKGGLTADETLGLVRQVAAGLDSLHQKGFIHRDIKSGNIFVGPGGHATILDFGILRPKEGGAPLTRTGMVMGTPHYMAPEQALGNKDVDHRVDLYALAVVLFECLTGTLPFEADSELKLIQLQAHAPPPDIMDRAPWVPKAVADVVRRGLAKLPESRFASGGEFVYALEEAYRQAKQPIGGTPPPPVVPTTTAPSLRRLADPPPVEPEPLLPAPTKRVPFVAIGAGVLMMAAVAAFAFRPTTSSVELIIDAGAPTVSVPDAAVVEPVVVAVELDAGSEEPIDAGVEDAGLPVAPLIIPDAGAPTPVAPNTKRKGRVSIVTLKDGEPYWAQVFIDSVARGRTPLQLDLVTGPHQVRIERPGFATQTKVIQVASGKPLVLRFALTP